MRKTVYWNPNVSVGDDGTIPIAYFNGDVSGKHHIIIEGLDAEGRLAREDFYYSVDRK